MFTSILKDLMILLILYLEICALLIIIIIASRESWTMLSKLKMFKHELNYLQNNTLIFF